MQSVIVYRNPLEAMMWESLMGGNLFIVIVAVVVFFIAFLISNRVLSGGNSYGQRAKYAANVSLVIGALAAAGTIYYMA